MSDRTLTPACVPFDTRRFSVLCRDSYSSRILKNPTRARLLFVIVCVRIPLPATTQYPLHVFGISYIASKYTSESVDGAIHPNLS